MLGLIAKRMFQLVDVLFVACLPLLFIGLGLGIFSISSGVQLPALLWGINTSIMGLALILLFFRCLIRVAEHRAEFNKEKLSDAMWMNGSLLLGLPFLVLFTAMVAQFILSRATGFLQVVILACSLILAIVEVHVKEITPLEQAPLPAIAITQEKEEE